MKILRRDVKHGTVAVLLEVLEDFWVLYNIIHRGDRVYAKTTREVRFGDRYDRPEKGKRISIYLGITVETVLWDRYLNRLRVHGIICEAPEEVGPGSHHTLNVTLGRSLTIVKDKWMAFELNQLKRATERGVPPVIVAAVDDEGFYVAIVRGYGLDARAEENISLPGKANIDERTRTLQKMFKSATKTLEETQSATKASIIILGLGFIKNQFIKYLEEKAPELRQAVIDVKSVNSTGKAGINEALRSGVLSKALMHLRIAEETEDVEEVLKRLGKERMTVTYGLAEVEKAESYGAVDRLLLTDIKLREAVDEDRLTLEKLMREVENKRGRVVIISTEHEAGIKLNSLGGIAALLRFPIG